MVVVVVVVVVLAMMLSSYEVSFVRSIGRFHVQDDDNDVVEERKI